jgi:hypothetical protein
LIIKPGRIRWAGHVESMMKRRGAYRILVEKPEGKKPIGKYRHRWEDNIKIDLKISWEDLHCFDL